MNRNPSDYEQQLADQNNGTLWVDCNERGMPHRWFTRHTVGDRKYWGCRRCPVDTRTALTDFPDRFLRRGSSRPAERTAVGVSRTVRP